MRDVSHKVNTLRTATASATLRARKETIARIKSGDLPKGDPLPVAKVAGVQAAKNTPQLIPYCHPVPVDFVDVRYEFTEDTVTAITTVKAVYKTGVEMEALAAATAAALTIYDMTKMVDEDAEILNVRLVEKRGGKSDFKAPNEATATVVTVSDSRNKTNDLSGPTACSVLEEVGVQIVGTTLVTDDTELIQQAVKEAKGALVVLTGGTGIAPRDVTPDAVAPLLDKQLPGVAEQIRRYGQDRTPMSMLSRSICGTMGEKLVLCLPGSPKGVEDGLRAVLPHLLHVSEVLRGAGHEGEAVP